MQLWAEPALPSSTHMYVSCCTYTTAPPRSGAVPTLAFPTSVSRHRVDFHHNSVLVSEDAVQLHELVHCLLVVGTTEAEEGGNLCSLLLRQT